VKVLTDDPSSPADTATAYHERTKHRLNRYARSLGYLDWDNQPDPFRRYEGAPRVRLARIEPQAAQPYLDEIYTPANIPAAALASASISQLLFDSFALSAWKISGASRWPLRCNPSSGNLHPTEVYVLLPALAGVSDQPAVHHYNALEHALECRIRIDDGEWSKLVERFPVGSFFVGLSSIHWREAWKYGERAYRYCQHDIGHAIAQLAYAAAALGWHVRVLDGIGDAAVAALLGIDRQSGAEAEHPDALLLLSPIAVDAAVTSVWVPPSDLLAALGKREWFGSPNVLSAEHASWDVIDQVALACRRPAVALDSLASIQFESPCALPQRPISARRVFRTRRSAQSMDGRSRLSLSDFARMVIRLLPSRNVPWAAQAWRPLIHPLLFVHRVESLAPGVFLLCRDQRCLPDLETQLGPLTAPGGTDGLPPGLPLYRLVERDVRDFARTSNCHQGIAADGAFSVAMLAEFERPMRDIGAWTYRRMFWEAGMLGQVLYLEAEAAGMRGTGIGCFFDDVIHEAFGLSGRTLQSLYGFTVGGALEDDRLLTEPAYSQLEDC
jgi:SagB-type dehydrogenase family enzyme